MIKKIAFALFLCLGIAYANPLGGIQALNLSQTSGNKLLEQQNKQAQIAIGVDKQKYVDNTKIIFLLQQRNKLIYNNKLIGATNSNKN